MTIDRKIFCQLVCISIIAITLVSCTRSTPTQFYVLNQMSRAHSTNLSHSSALTLGIGPVTLPKYLNQPQIVTRENHNQLFLDEAHRWAEPLHDNVTRVFADNLSGLLHGARIINYPWRGNTKMSYQITLDIRRFELDENNNCILIANWSIIRGNTRKVLHTHHSIYKIQSSGHQSYEQIAQLMSRNLMRLSSDIAKRLGAPLSS